MQQRRKARVECVQRESAPIKGSQINEELLLLLGVKHRATQSWDIKTEGKKEKTCVTNFSTSSRSRIYYMPGKGCPIRLKG